MMKVKGLTRDVVEDVVRRLGFKGWVHPTGNFLAISDVRRINPDYRISPAGANCHVSVNIEGKQPKAILSCFYHKGRGQEKAIPKTTILGNVDWYNLIKMLFRGGADRVDVLNQKFQSFNDYNTFVYHTNHWLGEYIGLERKVREKYN